MAKVAHEPVRAGMAETPEASAHTSVAERMAALYGAHQAAESTPTPVNDTPPEVPELQAPVLPS